MSEVKPSLAQLRRFVGNPDAYALQYEDGHYEPVRQKLLDPILQRHLDGEITVGVYIGHKVNGQTVARTLCFDIDDGDNEESLEKAKSIGKALEELGIPLASAGIEFSGRRGYHVWVLLQDYRPNAELRRAARATLAIAGTACEVYPKQNEVRDLGNLVKLPGGIHRLTGNTNNFLVKVPRPLPTQIWETVLTQLPPEMHARREASEVRFPCLAVIQDEGVEEGSRNIQLFHLATMLYRAGLTENNVELIVRATNEKRTPLEEYELSALLESSKHSGPICSQLPEERSCGELCLLKRNSSLFISPGQVKGAALGENVVVQVVGREGDIIQLGHDDILTGKAKIRGR